LGGRSIERGTRISYCNNCEFIFGTGPGLFRPQESFQLNKKWATELRTYELVVRLLEGEPCETLKLGEERYMIVSGFLALYMFYGIIAVLFYFKDHILLYVSNLVLLIPIVFLLFGSSIISLSTLILFNDHRRIMRKVRRFSEYQAQIRKKWGEDAV
jgi:hypothetical protein